MSISIFGSLSTVQMILHTMLRGKSVGTDMFGNKYYRGRPRKGTTTERRWVMYKDAPEASSVPAEWHGWLHHQTDVLPESTGRHRKPWQKAHQANMTGTDQAYLPPGHAAKGGQREAATGDYRAWQPPQ